MTTIETFLQRPRHAGKVVQRYDPPEYVPRYMYERDAPTITALLVGMTAVYAQVLDYGQKVWESGKAELKKMELKKRRSPAVHMISAADWNRFTWKLREDAGSMSVTTKRSSEVAGDTAEEEPAILLSPTADHAATPRALGGNILSSVAIIPDERRAIGIPAQGDTAEPKTDEPQEKSVAVLDAANPAMYGTMPKDVGDAWVHSTLLYHDGEDVATTHQAIREEMQKWGWNEAAMAATFSEIAKLKLVKPDGAEALKEVSSKPPVESIPEPAHPVTWKPVSPLPRTPESVAATSIRGDGNSGMPPPPSTYKDPERRRRWIPWVAAGAVVLAILGVVKACDTPNTLVRPEPSVSGAPNPGTTTAPVQETDKGGDKDHTNDSKYSEETQQMPQVHELKNGQLVVDATKWTPNRSTTYPTFWNTAGEQIRANEKRKPTMREFVFVKNALLKANNTTEASARRMHVGHDMFLLTATQYDAAMAKAHA